MTSLDSINTKISELEAYAESKLKEIRQDVAKLKTPCPLEEGKSVEFQVNERTFQMVCGWYFDMSVTHDGKVRLETRPHTQDGALSTARLWLEKYGTSD